jgi:DNA polymerase III sliding clamp (beta) subunit (PCNA family)
MNIAIDKAAVSVAKVARKPDKYGSRPVLEGVSITNGEARAADGFVLLVCPLPKENESDETVLLNAKELTTATKALKRGTLASIAPNGTHATVTAMTANRTALTLVSEIDGTFPDANQIFAQIAGDDVLATVTLNARILKTICEAFIAAHDGDAVPVVFRIRAEHKAVTLACQIEQGPDGRIMEGAFMPMIVGPKDSPQAQTRAERKETS